MLSIETSKSLVRYRFSIWELVPLCALIAVYFLLPNNLSFAAAVLVMAIFVLSLDLVIGFAGIITLGHSIFFGLGAYTAALLARNGWQEPISVVAAAATLAAVLALCIGPFLLRLKGLPLIMVTVGLAAIAHEGANKAAWLTGGHDGLPGLIFEPILGVFRWSIFGHTSYLYVAVWLVLMFVIARVIVSSSFGVALQGIRQNDLRMKVMGSPVLLQLTIVYAISGGMAGVAGALSAQTNGFVGIETLSVDLGVFALVMIVLGGIGRLYGAIIGAVIYMTIQYTVRQFDPYYWMLVVGTLLVLVMVFSRGGLMGLVADLKERFGKRSEVAK